MKTMMTVAILTLGVGCAEPIATSKAPVSTGATAVDAADLKLPETHRASDPGAPLDQPMNPADEDITASIRKKMMDTKMSPNLANVRVTTQDGVVKLRGTVKTEEEKEKVESIARSAAGAKSVDSQIEVE